MGLTQLIVDGILESGVIPNAVLSKLCKQP